MGLFTSALYAIIVTVLLLLNSDLLQVKSSHIDNDNDNEISSGTKLLRVAVLLFIVAFVYGVLIIRFWVSKSLLDGTESRQSRLVKRWYYFHFVTNIIICIVLIATVHGFVLIMGFGRNTLKSILFHLLINFIYLQMFTLSVTLRLYTISLNQKKTIKQLKTKNMSELKPNTILLLFKSCKE